MVVHINRVNLCGNKNTLRYEWGEKPAPSDTLLDKLLMNGNIDVDVGGPKRNSSTILKVLEIGLQSLILPCWTPAGLAHFWTNS